MSEPTREDLWQAARNELQARLDARDATIEELEAENRMLQANYDVVIAAMQQAEAENRQLREALREYADKRSWDRGEHGRLNVFNRDTNGPFIAFTAIAFAAIRGGGARMGEWKDGGSAFPAVGEVYGDENDSRWSPGMSLRDYFAATATEKDISEYLPVTDGEARRLKERVGVTQMRQWARYKHADAMLFERERENE